MKYCPKCGTRNPAEAKFCSNCGYDFNSHQDTTNDHSRAELRQSAKASGSPSRRKRSHFWLIALIILVIVIGAFMFVRQSHGGNFSLGNTRQSTSSSIQKNQITGSYKDSTNDVAMSLNANGTGRYVYADPENSNTDDQLTWKKAGTNTYTLNLQNSNVTSPLTAKLNNGKLVLSGDSNWHTVTLYKNSRTINLDHFLAKEDPKTHQQGSSHSSGNSNTNLSTQQLGTLVALYAMPDWFKSGIDDGLWYGTDHNNDNRAGYSYVTANGDPTGWLYFKQNGNDVTIKYVHPEGDESVAETPTTTKHLTIDRLISDYYVNQSQKNEVNGCANKLKPESDYNNNH
ncbi:DUF3642 domain-containing protein [Limosilactobacillus sp.]|uniref:Lreu_0056 family protein n=1 Tax=Limosilactobacillus sp. TaxID=2773925 RepID=UPI0035A04762